MMATACACGHVSSAFPPSFLFFLFFFPLGLLESFSWFLPFLQEIPFVEGWGGIFCPRFPGFGFGIGLGLVVKFRAAWNCFYCTGYSAWNGQQDVPSNREIASQGVSWLKIRRKEAWRPRPHVWTVRVRTKTCPKPQPN